MTESLTSPLPPLYAAWVEDLLGDSIPPETRATCHDCVMCDDGADYKAPDSIFFNPNAKCCTYLPEISNFLAGQILTDADPAISKGRGTIEARINEGIAVTPLGLGRHPKYALLYDNMDVQVFGRAQSLRCPHYIHEQGGLCGIWKYRNSICSTWFCRHVRGAAGNDFWQTGKYLLAAIEQDLARWCVSELEIGGPALELLFKVRRPEESHRIDLDSLESRANAETLRRVWGTWFGREQDFYRECARLVTALKWQDVLSVCGPQVRIRANLLKRSHQNLASTEIPHRLRLANFNVTESGPDFYRVNNPAFGSESFSLSTRLMALLWYFDGRPTAEVVEQIIEEKRLRITPALLLRLVDFRILIACE